MPQIRYLKKVTRPYGYDLVGDVGDIATDVLVKELLDGFSFVADSIKDFRSWPNKVNSPLDWDSSPREGRPEMAVYNNEDALLAHCNAERFCRLVGKAHGWLTFQEGDAELLKHNKDLLTSTNKTLDVALQTYNNGFQTNSKPYMILAESYVTEHQIIREIPQADSLLPNIVSVKTEYYTLQARHQTNPNMPLHLLLWDNQETYVATEPLRRGTSALIKEWLDFHSGREWIIETCPQDITPVISLDGTLPGELFCFDLEGLKEEVLLEQTRDALKLPRVADEKPAALARRINEALQKETCLVPTEMYQSSPWPNPMQAKPLPTELYHEIAGRAMSTKVRGSGLTISESAHMTARLPKTLPIGKVYYTRIGKDVPNASNPGISLLEPGK